MSGNKSFLKEYPVVNKKIKKRFLVTGGAGFIGSKTVEKILQRGDKVVCIDNLNSYYDPGLKKYRLNIFKNNKNFIYFKGDIENKKVLKKIFDKYSFDAIINLAARAGHLHLLRVSS